MITFTNAHCFETACTPECSLMETLVAMAVIWKYQTIFMRPFCCRLRKILTNRHSVIPIHAVVPILR
jgi:hypothetical protein